ncbi:MAG: efflux transporter outer membrane subunit [Verrucomicrobiota bacterium JB024]|nr:efflux transporter outer membrane subunit [Verrucomicrobiota bacterium JB024]
MRLVRHKPSWQRLPLLLLAALLGGCAVGPDYTKPEITTPDAWQLAIVGETPGEADAPIQSWWEMFNDPVLNGLIEDARESNLTLQIALANVREARARLAYTGGTALPEVQAFGQAASTKLSDNGAFSQMAPPGGFHSQGMMAFGLDAAWEIDVFGRIRRQVEAESAAFSASVESYRDVLVSLYAEVALTYIEIRACQVHIANAESNIKVQTQSLDLTEERFNDGLTSQLDVEQAKSNLYNTRAAIPLFRIRMNAAYNRLAVLCGKDPGTLQTEVGGAGVLPSPGMNLSAGVPADLLRQRPDIRQAERELAAATARIGAATADLYPRFALKGAIGLESRSFSDLFDSSSMVWTMAAPVHWNIFTAGRTLDNIEIHEEKQQQALLNYRQVILQAMEEVENALTSYNEYRQRGQELDQAAQAAESAVELVSIQYDSGLTNFNNVLDTERSLYEQQNSLISSQTDSLRSIVALYKAIGGGWNSADAPDLKGEKEEVKRLGSASAARL